MAVLVYKIGSGVWFLVRPEPESTDHGECHVLAPECRCVYIYLPLVDLPFGLHHKFYFVQCIISCPNVLQSKLDAELNFAHLMEQLPVTNFSTVEINFEPAWHIYGALVLQLLRIRRICVAAKVLKVILPQLPKVILRHPY
jgi:hypothetical protein